MRDDADLSFSLRGKVTSSTNLQAVLTVHCGSSAERRRHSDSLMRLLMKEDKDASAVSSHVSAPARPPCPTIHDVMSSKQQRRLK